MGASHALRRTRGTPGSGQIRARIPPTLPSPSLRALAAGLHALIRPGAFGGVLERELRVLFPDARAFCFGSGRAALSLAIKAALRSTGRNTVVLPAYTSFSVAAAAAAAGARCRLCDLDIAALDLDRSDLRSCVDGDTAALVVGSLYGYPSSLSDLSWLHERGVLVIDDAAQALGATADGVRVGGRGHLGILSLGRGKCVTAGQAGALLVHEPALEPFVNDLARGLPPASRGVSAWLTAFGVRLSSSRLLFDLIVRLPGVGIAESRYDPAFGLARESAAANGLCVDLARTADRLLRIRSRIAHSWHEALRGVRAVRHIAPLNGTGPAYLRLPVLAASAHRREALAECLAREGFSFVRSFPAPLSSIPEFRSCCDERPTPGADRLARTILALPCHPRITARDVRRAATALRRAGDGSARTATVVSSQAG